MSKLQKQINERFIAKLAESKVVHSEIAEQLRALMATSKKPKADEIVKIFQDPGGGDIK
jgi:hypothetical protein